MRKLLLILLGCILCACSSKEVVEEVKTDEVIVNKDSDSSKNEILVNKKDDESKECFDEKKDSEVKQDNPSQPVVKKDNESKEEPVKKDPVKNESSTNNVIKEETKPIIKEEVKIETPKEEVKKEEPHVHDTFFACEEGYKATGCLTYYDPTVYVDTLDESDEYAWRIADELGIGSCRWTSRQCSCGKIGTILFNVKYWEE